MTRPGLNFSVRVGYAMGNVKPQTTKRAEEPPVRRSVRVGAASLGVLVMALLAAAFSGAVRGQAPAASSSAPNDPSAAAAPWQWRTPDARAIEIDRGAAGLWQTLLKLHTRASLLMFTAHPDDEDGAMPAYEARGQGPREPLLRPNP